MHEMKFVFLLLHDGTELFPNRPSPLLALPPTPPPLHTHTHTHTLGTHNLLKIFRYEKILMRIANYLVLRRLFLCA